MARITLLVALFFAFPIVCVADEKQEKAKETRALTQSQILLRACDAFKIHPANEGARYPVALLNLKKPPWGGGSYVDNDKDLLDPWGKPFHYGVAVDEKGNVRAYVWSERKVDGKTTIVGTKLPEPKR